MQFIYFSKLTGYELPINTLHCFKYSNKLGWTANFEQNYIFALDSDDIRS